MSTPVNKINKRWIKPLPERVINKIAAGEVIERPSAVVKELVENAIDAGARKIDIFIEKSGTKLIKIIDDGCGIDEAQVEIAFSRHATSKIRNFDDLNNLYSYGFRGEALPSIASISQLRMVTRTNDTDIGTEIIYEGGVLQSKQPVAAQPGTLIEVENIFFNTPARRKFLKAEATEARYISRTAMAMAIGRFNLGFSYTLNNRNIFSLPSESNLEERVSSIIGMGKKMVAVKGESGPVKVTGHIGTPEMVQNNRFGQFIFVNYRYIQSASLAHALVAGYGELIPRGSFPIGALLLTVDADEVDVNVHPTKAEVRLSREREIHDAVCSIVKESLKQDGIIPIFKGTDFKADNKQNNTIADSSKSLFSNKAYIPGVQPEEADSKILAELYKKPETGFQAPQSDSIKVDKNTGEILPDNRENQLSNSPVTISGGFRILGRFSDLYLILQSGNDLFIVDQHTAHERVLFEETLKKIEKSNLEGQNLLFPVQVKLNPEQFAIFDEILEVLNSTGFMVSHFGGKMVNIESVPSILKKKSPEKSFLKILDDVASLKKVGYDQKKAIAQSIACRSAIMAGDNLSDKEANHLIARLLECDNKYSCPHGRPTFVIISREDLDKKFGRK